MPQIELVANDNPKTSGHLFCNDCSTELMVVLDNWPSYLHPQYKPEWNLPWHEHHNIKYLYPDLIKVFWDKDFTYSCPYCSNEKLDDLIHMDNNILDAKIILKSLDETYICHECSKEFEHPKCVRKIGRYYICSDCML